MKLAQIQQYPYTQNHQLLTILPIGIQPDFFLISTKVIFPFRKQLLKKCAYFLKIDLSKENIHVFSDDLNVINKNIQVFALTNILKYYYFPKWRFNRDRSLIDILEVAAYLDCPQIKKEVCFDIENNFEEYGIFLALRLSRKLSIGKLEQKCWREILAYNFEFININKTDLLEEDQKTFVSILRNHYHVKKANIIKGISDHNVEIVINEYCQLHHCKISNTQIEKPNSDQIAFIDMATKILNQIKEESEIEPQKQVRSRQRTWDQAFSRTAHKQKETKIENIDIKKELKYLAEINNRMKSQSLRFIKQIKEVKSKLNNEPLMDQELVKKFSDYEQKWEQFEHKYVNICRQLNLRDEIDGRLHSKSSEQTFSPSSSTEDQVLYQSVSVSFFQ